MNPGLYPGLSLAAYHADSRLSKSGLDLIARSPAHYQQALLTPRPATPAMRLGQAVHCAVLEPHAFPGRYPITPAVDRRTTAGKTQWAAWQARCPGDSELLTPDEGATIQAMAQAVRHHPTAARLLAVGEGMAELSAFATLDDVAVKARPDWLRPDGLCIDLKTTTNSEPSAFARACLKWRYHVQAAFYTDVLAALDLELSAFLFITVESVPPYAVAVYVPEPEAIRLGRRLYERDLATYRRCRETGQWPAYHEVQTLTLPAYAYYATED